MAAKNIVYFDLETQRLLRDVAHKKEELKISIAATYSTATEKYSIYTETEVDKLCEELLKADLVIGWNHVEFDYPVLQHYVLPILEEQTQNLDMMLDIQKIIGKRVGLGSAATNSLGLGKSAVGTDAVLWWREYVKTGDFEPLRKIAEYCAYDVKVTRYVHEFGMKHGYIKYDYRGEPGQVEVHWKR